MWVAAEGEVRVGGRERIWVATRRENTTHYVSLERGGGQTSSCCPKADGTRIREESRGETMQRTRVTAKITAINTQHFEGFWLALRRHISLGRIRAA